MADPIIFDDGLDALLDEPTVEPMVKKPKVEPIVKKPEAKPIAQKLEAKPIAQKPEVESDDDSEDPSIAYNADLEEVKRNGSILPFSPLTKKDFGGIWREERKRIKGLIAKSDEDLESMIE